MGEFRTRAKRAIAKVSSGRQGKRCKRSNEGAGDCKEWGLAQRGGGVEGFILSGTFVRLNLTGKTVAGVESRSYSLGMGFITVSRVCWEYS